MNVDRFRGTDHEWDAFGSPMPEWNRVSANMGLYWAFIERACAGGLSRFNFGRCTPESPTHRYKQQWGARDEPLWCYQGAAEGGAGPSPESPAFTLVRQVWKRLPVALATALGPRIVRFIP